MNHGAGRAAAARESLGDPAEEDLRPFLAWEGSGSAYEPDERELLDAGVRSGLGGWAVPWSDLMMVMFILFLVLFATQAHEREVGHGFDPEAPSSAPVPGAFPAPDPRIAVRDPDLAPHGSVFQRSLAAATEAGVRGVDVVLDPDLSVRVGLGGPLFFDPASADLREGATGFLDELAVVLGETERSVRIVGHTDDTPIESERFPSNWELSSARAAAVARHLIAGGGLDARRFRVVGRGEFAPIAPNADPRSRGRNRRVDVVIEAPRAPAPAPEAS